MFIFSQNPFFILHPSLENSTTSIAITSGSPLHHATIMDCFLHETNGETLMKDICNFGNSQSQSPITKFLCKIHFEMFNVFTDSYPLTPGTFDDVNPDARILTP